VNKLFRFATGGTAPRAALLVRLGVGGVFFLEGIKKFLFVAQWGAGRFEHIGIPWPHVMAPFDGAFEIACGALLLIGLLTRLAAVPLLVDILVAIGTTKIPLLLKSGFWAMEADARTDFAMLCGLLFLAVAGAGSISLDARVRPSP
jgi:putative oxidoreductase